MDSEPYSNADPLLPAVCLAVAHRRNELGISQEELARRASLHRTYISDIERGARNPTLKTLSRIASALEMAASDLLKQAEDNYLYSPQAFALMRKALGNKDPHVDDLAPAEMVVPHLPKVTPSST